MLKLIPKEEFLAGVQCLRCGVFGSEKLCTTCIHLKKCKTCSIVLREKFRFYRYDPNKRGTVYKEVSYIIHSPYPPISDKECVGCVDWEKGMKFECYACGEWFPNTLNNYKINGNFCLKHNGNEASTIKG